MQRETIYDADESGSVVYMAVTADAYELPVGVGLSRGRLAHELGVDVNSIERAYRKPEGSRDVKVGGRLLRFVTTVL